MLELPEYRLPGLNTLIMHLWDKCKDFLTRAGTLIFSMSVIIWVLRNFDFTFHAASSGGESILGRLGGGPLRRRLPRWASAPGRRPFPCFRGWWPKRRLFLP